MDLTKDGCPAAEVNIAAWFRHGGPYPECTDWRTSAMAQIAALHPALVIATEASYLEVPEARPLAGVPTGHGGAWLNGLAAIFRFLNRSAAHVVFISDVPTPRQYPPGCVSRHMSDVQRCDTKLSAAIRLPDVKGEELELAGREHVDAVDPTSWFCASTHVSGDRRQPARLPEHRAHGAGVVALHRPGARRRDRADHAGRGVIT